MMTKEMMEKLDYDSIFLTSIAFSIIKEKYNKNLSETLVEVNQAIIAWSFRQSVASSWRH